jgi:hypothetical protein
MARGTAVVADAVPHSKGYGDLPRIRLNALRANTDLDRISFANDQFRMSDK